MKRINILPNILFNILLATACFYTSKVTAQSTAQSIEIRPAATHEIPSIIELDQRVTYEFFKPLLADTYNHLGVDCDVDHIFQEELITDEQTFVLCVNHQDTGRLHVAWDQKNNIPCGLILFHKNQNNEVLIDILLVDKDYRGKGIGKKLVHSIFQAFKDIKTLNVYPLQFNNESTLKFYESLGFKNLGVGPADKNLCGIAHSDLYYHFELRVTDTTKSARDGSDW